MVRTAYILNKLKSMGYTIDDSDTSVVYISLKTAGDKTYTTKIFKYDLFKTHIVDDVVSKINDLIMEDYLKEM